MKKSLNNNIIYRICFILSLVVMILSSCVYEQGYEAFSPNDRLANLQLKIDQSGLVSDNAIKTIDVLIFEEDGAILEDYNQGNIRIYSSPDEPPIEFTEPMELVIRGVKPGRHTFYFIANFPDGDNRLKNVKSLDEFKNISLDYVNNPGLLSPLLIMVSDGISQYVSRDNFNLGNVLLRHTCVKVNFKLDITKEKIAEIGEIVGFYFSNLSKSTKLINPIGRDAGDTHYFNIGKLGTPGDAAVFDQLLKLSRNPEDLATVADKITYTGVFYIPECIAYSDNNYSKFTLVTQKGNVISEKYTANLILGSNAKPGEEANSTPRGNEFIITAEENLGFSLNLQTLPWILDALCVTVGQYFLEVPFTKTTARPISEFKFTSNAPSVTCTLAGTESGFDVSEIGIKDGKRVYRVVVYPQAANPTLDFEIILHNEYKVPVLKKTIPVSFLDGNADYLVVENNNVTITNTSNKIWYFSTVGDVILSPSSIGGNTLTLVKETDYRGYIEISKNTMTQASGTFKLTAAKGSDAYEQMINITIKPTY